jgi:hypothetical protein
MNAKELESLVKDQGAMIEGLKGRITEQAASIEAMKKGRDEALAKIVGRIDGMGDAFSAIGQAMHDDQIARNLAHEQLTAAFVALNEIVDDHTVKIDGRNKSAPTKRNMTDADALSVLTGDYKGMPHKDAAEKIGLTYAQVYSARLEFTFKHVHKTLREEKWENPWAK